MENLFNFRSLAGRPVLGHCDCCVTQGHVQRNKDGLWFSTVEMFSQTVHWLLRTPRKASKMGRNGQKYVQKNSMLENCGRTPRAASGKRAS